MDVDKTVGAGVTELKIKGQAEVERRKNRWGDGNADDVRN